MRYTITLDPNPFDPVLSKEPTKTAMLCAQCVAGISFDEPPRLDATEEKPKPRLMN